MNIATQTLWIAIGMGVTATVVLTARRSQREIAETFKRKDMLNSTERRVLEELQTRAERHVAICPAVRLADIVQPERGRKGFNKIAQKHVDFVIYDKRDNYVISVVEIDGPTHSSEKQKKRDKSKDAILTSAGIRVHRFKAGTWKTPQQLQEVFKDERNNSVPRPMQNPTQA